MVAVGNSDLKFALCATEFRRTPEILPDRCSPKILSPDTEREQLVAALCAGKAKSMFVEIPQTICR